MEEKLKQIEEKLRLIEKSQVHEERHDVFKEVKDLIIWNLNNPQYRNRTLLKIKPYLRVFTEQMDKIKDGTKESFYYEKVFQFDLLKLIHIIGDEVLVNMYKNKINIEELVIALKELKFTNEEIKNTLKEIGLPEFGEVVPVSSKFQEKIKKKSFWDYLLIIIAIAIVLVVIIAIIYWYLILFILVMIGLGPLLSLLFKKK